MDWRELASCHGLDPEAWFDVYESNIDIRPGVDKMCSECPVRKMCFATGVSNKEWGVWGGVYLQDGEPTKEFNEHKTADDWNELWLSLTMG
jgi:hypothetical protein